MRIPSFLYQIISPEQGAFVKGAPTKNVSFVHESMQEIGKKSYSKNVIFKLDMEKAFDRVEWHFLYKVLKQFRFDEKFLEIISRCLSVSHCSVL